MYSRAKTSEFFLLCLCVRHMWADDVEKLRSTLRAAPGLQPPGRRHVPLQSAQRVRNIWFPAQDVRSPRGGHLLPIREIKQDRGRSATPISTRVTGQRRQGGGGPPGAAGPSSASHPSSSSSARGRDFTEGETRWILRISARGPSKQNYLIGR